MLLLGVHVHGLDRRVNGTASWYRLPRRPEFSAQRVRQARAGDRPRPLFHQVPLRPARVEGLPASRRHARRHLSAHPKGAEPRHRRAHWSGVLALCHIAGAKFRHLLAVVALAVLLLSGKVAHKSYQHQRITNWLHPTAAAEMAGNYQITLAQSRSQAGGLTSLGSAPPGQVRLPPGSRHRRHSRHHRRGTRPARHVDYPTALRLYHVAGYADRRPRGRSLRRPRGRRGHLPLRPAGHH